jgi:hypothetical protein
MVRSHPGRDPAQGQVGPSDAGNVRLDTGQLFSRLYNLSSDADNSEYVHGVDVRRIIKQRSGKDLMSTALCVIAENCRRICLGEWIMVASFYFGY